MLVYLFNTHSNFTVTKTGKYLKLFSLEVDSTVFKSGVFLTKFRHKLLLSLSARPEYV